MRIMKILLVIFLSLLVLEIAAYLVIVKIQSDKQETAENYNLNGSNSSQENSFNNKVNSGANGNSVENQLFNRNSNSSLNTNLTAGPGNDNINSSAREEEFVFSLEAKTDKKIYYSGEQIRLEITLLSSQNLENITVSAQGIVSQYGHIYFDKSQNINLVKNQPQKISFISVLPVCSSCSGVNPGDYAIEITAVSGRESLKTSSIIINLKQ